MTRFPKFFVMPVAFWALAGLSFAQTPQPSNPTSPATAPASVPQVAQPQPEASFGEATDLSPRPALMLDGTASWDDFYTSSRKALEQLERTAKAQTLIPAGAPMVRVQTANDETVIFTAFLPIVQLPQSHTVPIAPVKLGDAPSGPHLKFTHQGAYDTIDQTYGEITDYLEAKELVAEDYFVEEYPLDPDVTPETEMKTYIYVRLKK